MQTKDTAKGMLLLNILNIVAPSSAPAVAVVVVVATSVANASNRSRLKENKLLQNAVFFSFFF